MLQERSSNYNGLDKLPNFCVFSLKTAAQGRKTTPCPCTFQKYCEVVKEKKQTPWKICVDQINSQWFFIQSIPEVLSFVKSIYKASRSLATGWLFSLPCLSRNWGASVSPIWPPAGCDILLAGPPWAASPTGAQFPGHPLGDHGTCCHRLSSLPWWWCFGHVIVRWGWEWGSVWDIHLSCTICTVVTVLTELMDLENCTLTWLQLMWPFTGVK